MRWLDRITWSDAQVEAEALQQRTRTLAATPIADAVAGEPTIMAGTVRTVTVRPRTGVSALEAELYDGTGTVTLVWLGQRQLRGITPGRPMVVYGRLTCREGRSFVFNPRYELRPFGS
jgi:DNA/RNA endonuclease YhcR with UshA esterase domain